MKKKIPRILTGISAKIIVRSQQREALRGRSLRVVAIVFETIHPPNVAETRVECAALEMFFKGRRAWR